MSLISLLIALVAERHLKSPLWQFRTYYQHYFNWLKRISAADSLCQNSLVLAAAILLPTILVSVVMQLISDSFLHLVLSTVILIICFGCIKSRDTYKKFLHAAFRGELTSCDIYCQELGQDKSVTVDNIGELLILLNYRYYIAIMLFFVLFGAAGVVFYRLLVTVVEKRGDEQLVLSEQVNASCSNLLQLIDWLPVRLTTFGYMFVGHFSKAFSTWLETLFDFNKTANAVLTEVAKKAEDFMLDPQDCTAEPCLMVRLAKRNVLLFLAVISVFTITGFIQ
jgi:AmpE protein